MSEKIEAYKEQIITQLLPISEIEEKLQNAIIAVAEFEQYNVGEFIFEEGSRDDYVYYVLKGSVELISNSFVEYIVVGGSENAQNIIAKLQPRQFSARARDSVEMLRINRVDMDRLVACQGAQVQNITPHDHISIEAEESEESDWMTKMLQSDWFVQLPMENIQKLFGLLSPIAFEAGEIVIKQGDIGDSYFVIQEGVCEVLKAPSKDEPPKKVAELSIGDHFGEEALLTSSTRNATIRMLTSGILMRLSKKDFMQLIHKPTIESVLYDQAKEMVAAGGRFIDVRSAKEHKAENITGSINIPLGLVRMQLGNLNPTISYVTYCDTGSQSSAAAFLMIQHGLTACYVKGGVHFTPKVVTKSADQKLTGNIEEKVAKDTDSRFTANIEEKVTKGINREVVEYIDKKIGECIDNKVAEYIDKKVTEHIEQYKTQLEEIKSAYQAVLEAESNKK